MTKANEINITFNGIAEANNQLNIDLDTVTRWANQWTVTFKPTKVKSMLLTLKQNIAF